MVSADLQSSGGPGGVRLCEWLQGASRWEAPVLLAADVLLMPSRRFVANISKLAHGQEASPSLTKAPSQLEIPDSELSSTYAGTEQSIKKLIVVTMITLFC